ncbi:hypothetical protein AcV7_007247 [Taiwanofungus camphoratus]|nr:hypothetical protein AcV7_007247 [Antrodia cinnamomea]
MCDLLPPNVTVGKPEQEIENSDQAASPANRSFDKLHDHAGHNSSAHRNNQKGKITHGHRSDMRESSLLFLLAFPSIPSISAPASTLLIDMWLTTGHAVHISFTG